MRPLLVSPIRRAGVAIVGGGEVTPDILEDFSTYTDTADMLSDPRGIYLEAECIEQDHNPEMAAGVVALDTGVGFGTSDRSLRFDWDSFGSPGAGGTISRAIDTGSATNIWCEVWHKFSSNFETDNGFSGGVGYKFIFLNQNGGGAGRFAFEWTNQPGHMSMYPNDAAWGASEQFHFEIEPGIEEHIADQEWHRYRMHVRLSGGDLLAGQIDDGPVTSTDDVGGFTTASSSIWNVALGKNMNQRPLAAQSNWWGRCAIWLGSNDPGWGW